MKKFIVICLLFVCCFSKTMASSGRDVMRENYNEYFNKIFKTPTEFINSSFSFLKKSDYREKEEIFYFPTYISERYPNNPSNQKEAILAFGNCLRNQKENGVNKYTEKDVKIVTTFAFRKLGLE